MPTSRRTRRIHLQLPHKSRGEDAVRVWEDLSILLITWLTASRRRKAALSIVIVVAVVATVGFLAHGAFLRHVAAGLVCSSDPQPSDAIVIENVDDEYLLFERAQRLEARGIAGLVLVPVLGTRDDGRPGKVALGVSELMCRMARLHSYQLFPVPEQEPISLHVARAVGRQLRDRGLHSAIVVSSAFRSRRAQEIYERVLPPMGIEVRCEPVFGSQNVDNWTESWHGIQAVGLQFAKLWYYRLFVLWRVDSFASSTPSPEKALVREMRPRNAT